MSAHARSSGNRRRLWPNPVEIVLGYIFGKSQIGLLLLHLQHLHHLAVCTAQFQFPLHYAAIDIHPVLPRAAVHNLHGYLSVFLPVSALRHFRHDFAAVYVLFQGQEYLVGVYRLDEVIGNLRTYGLIHDVLLFALGAHYDWRSRLNVLYLLQGLQSAESRHHLVEQDKVKGLPFAFLYCVGAVADGNHLIAFLLQEDDVCLQQLYFIIHPQ